MGETTSSVGGQLEDTDFVEVLDMTVLVAVPGQDGEPAKLRYTVREHQGDVVTEGPGALTIQFGPRELPISFIHPNGRTLRGRKVTLASAQLIGMETDIRLEPRVRPSVASLINPEKASVDKLKAAHGVVTAIS